MSRRFRIVVGLALLLALLSGTTAPAVARPLLPAKKGVTVAITEGWATFVRWMRKAAAPAPLSTTFAYGTDAPLTPLTSSSATASPHGTDAPRVVQP